MSCSKHRYLKKLHLLQCYSTQIWIHPYICNWLRKAGSLFLLERSECRLSVWFGINELDTKAEWRKCIISICLFTYCGRFVGLFPSLGQTPWLILMKHLDPLDILVDPAKRGLCLSLLNAEWRICKDFCIPPLFRRFKMVVILWVFYSYGRRYSYKVYSSQNY